jgi:hypothetical protein
MRISMAAIFSFCSSESDLPLSVSAGPSTLTIDHVSGGEKIRAF